MTRKEQNKILDDKIESNNNQYKIDRLNAEISGFSSGDLNKYEFLTRKDLNYKPNALDQARFEFSPLGRAFNEGLDKTIPNYQEENVIKLLKEIRDNLAGGTNIPAGLIIPPGPPGPQGPQGPIPPVPPAPPLIIPKPRTPSPQRPRLRPKLPSEIKESDDGDFNEQLNDVNKQLDDFIKRIKSKQSRDLVNKKLIDIVNNVGNRRLDSPDINLLPDFSSLRNLVDEINKDQSDQIDYDELAWLAINKLLPGQLTQSMSTIPPPYLFRTRKRKATSKKLEDTNNILDEYTKKQFGTYPGEIFTILTKEADIANDHDNIRYLENKSHDTSLSFDEHNKILNNIIQIKENIIKKEKELDKLKKDLEKRIGKSNIPINIRKTSSKRLEDTDNILDEYINKHSGSAPGEKFAILSKEADIANNYDNILDEYTKKHSGSAPGEKFAILSKEADIANDYDNIKYLENKLNDTSLNFDELAKSLNDISQAKNIYLKKKKN